MQLTPFLGAIPFGIWIVTGNFHPHLHALVADGLFRRDPPPPQPAAPTPPHPPTPEPSTLALSLVGGFGLLLAVRRFRHA